MTHSITTELLDSAIAALVPLETSDLAIPGPTRNAEGSPNPQAWSQVLTLFSWFGFDALPLHAEVVASALSENIEFPTELLSIQSVDLVFLGMSAAIEEYLSIGGAVAIVGSLRDAIEVMAKVLRDSGELFDDRTLLELRKRLDGLDELINKRIEGEKL